MFLIFFGITYLLYTPIKSKFVTHLGNMDFRFGILDICLSFTNTFHIIGFGILSLLLLQSLSDNRKYIKTLLILLLFGFLIEITQIFFVNGHFRLRDIVSNLLGILLSFIFYRVLLNEKENQSNKKILLLTLLIICMQIAISIIIYYVFKELSILLGGEILKKYL